MKRVAETFWHCVGTSLCDVSDDMKTVVIRSVKHTLCLTDVKDRSMHRMAFIAIFHKCLMLLR